MNELDNCPFCGCSMQIIIGEYPDGDKIIEPYGQHNNDCPLRSVIWNMYSEDGWTEENLVERWNKRAYG